ncbi:MAG: sulfatase-like hydrolase/transferase [Planctomycetota bacterium]
MWITCEDTSPYLGCYGDPFARTPNLDRFAGESIVYTNAYATAPVCAPARSCLATGVYATSTGTQHLRSEVPLSGRVEPFPKLLRAAGYYCSNNYKEDYNFTDLTMWDDSSPTAHWRNRRLNQPFFSVFNLMSTHQGKINGSDEEFFQAYRSKLTEAERHDENALRLPPYFPDTPMVRKIWGRYYDLITYMDKQVAEILAELEADALAEDTIVFFFSDHGMGLPRHKRTLYDTGLRVPLMVRFPARLQRLMPLAPGGRTDRLVSFVDFAPTVLHLLGLDVPESMQGQTFLGRQPAAPRDYVYGASSRVDEVYEMSRCVRDKRYKYIRNFMPHLPYIQPSEYPDRAEIMQELRRVVAVGGMVGPQEDLWKPTKPVEELFDTQTDPQELRNLAGSPAHRSMLDRLRKQLRDWMIETNDTGLMSEAEMHIRAEGSTPYDVVNDPDAYDPGRILATAELVGTGPDALPQLREALWDGDGAVRYWAAVGLEALGAEAAPAIEDLKEVLDDPSPNVRFTAAGVLCKLGQCREALPVLTQGLRDERETVVLHAARTLQSIGTRARPAVRQMRLAQERCRKLDGSYRNDDHAMFIDWALKYALENCQE